MSSIEAQMFPCKSQAPSSGAQVPPCDAQASLLIICACLKGKSASLKYSSVSLRGTSALVPSTSSFKILIYVLFTCRILVYALLTHFANKYGKQSWKKCCGVPRSKSAGQKCSPKCVNCDKQSKWQNSIISILLHTIHQKCSPVTARKKIQPKKQKNK